MNFLKGFDKIVSRDDLRPSLGVVKIKDGKAVATDSHKLVVVDLKLYGITKEDIDNLEGFCIDLDTLNEIKLKKGQVIEFGKGKINVIKGGRQKPLKIIELSTEEELGIVFPRYEAILGQPEKSITSISIAPQLLVDVENVYNSLPELEENKRELLTMVFCGEGQGFRVQNFNGSFHALVMPRKVTGYKDLSK